MANFSTSEFKSGLKVLIDGEPCSILENEVVKPGKELDNQMVDGISGGTFTSVGVQEMMDRTLKIYYDYFKKNK